MELNIIAPNVAGGGDTLLQTRSAAGDLGRYYYYGRTKRTSPGPCDSRIGYGYDRAFKGCPQCSSL